MSSDHSFELQPQLVSPDLHRPAPSIYLTRRGPPLCSRAHIRSIAMQLSFVPLLHGRACILHPRQPSSSPHDILSSEIAGHKCGSSGETDLTTAPAYVTHMPSTPQRHRAASPTSLRLGSRGHPVRYSTLPPGTPFRRAEYVSEYLCPRSAPRVHPVRHTYRHVGLGLPATPVLSHLQITAPPSISRIPCLCGFCLLLV